MTTPVSLPLTNTVPSAANLPSSIPLSLITSQTLGNPNATMGSGGPGPITAPVGAPAPSSANAGAPGGGSNNPGGPSPAAAAAAAAAVAAGVAGAGGGGLAGLNPSLPTPQAVSTTRILHLSNFSPDLKTRDIQSIFAEWEDDRGGFKIKWVDDTTCLIVFNDPITAKKSFLQLLSNPHPLLTLPTPTSPTGATLRAHTGPDVTHILTSVQNRPRSRSNAASGPGGTHSRKSSMNVNSGGGGGGGGSHGGTSGRRDSQSGSGSYGRRQASLALNGGGSHGHSRSNTGSQHHLPSASQIQATIESATNNGPALSTSPPKVGSINTANLAAIGGGPGGLSTSPISTSPINALPSGAAPSAGQTADGNASTSPPKVSDAGKRFVTHSLGVKTGPGSGAGSSGAEELGKRVKDMTIQEGAE